MELRVNDLLKIKSVNDLIGDVSEASWIDEAIKSAPYVVVRRAPIMNNKVPVGIRGNSRSQRLATTVLSGNIIDIITPEQLVVGKLWRDNKHISNTKMLRTLEAVDSIFKSYRITWGPTGSVGFELASGVETITNTSDLDIIARTPEVLPIWIAEKIENELLEMPIKIDVQLETLKGSIALAEYARGSGKVMLRTLNGPMLVLNPWSDYEQLEG
ncbi:malonate decarboxylase holo-ACP synthase [Anaeromicropila herbilytica]|uniref:Malonate decarboxylase holo-ACP synthase n=1 Tax=Anaeromicropila herbilytica TaxID=2785025 RepID=A0A7R7IG31_9FIRM|nr:malonate decarboxylase holo-ACP synthase [Anaeromicropila herbilytica]BCN32663.1 malonate decarboxylase holo-ACP synthase [Anaeromicropila herbilytica]